MPRPTRNKRMSTSFRRKQIVETIRKLIIAHGSENITVRRIARAIGVTEGAIYRHFKNKREILSFLVDYIEENLLGDIRRNKDSRDTLTLLQNIFKNHLSYIEQRKGVSYLVIAEILSIGDKRLNKRVSDTLNKYLDEIRRIILGGIRAGQIRENIDPRTAAEAFFGIIQGLVTLWALGDHSFNLEKRYRSTWNIFCEAIKKD